MSKGIVAYMAVIAVALTSVTFMVKRPSSSAAQAKSALQVKMEARKQALAEI